MGEQTNKSLRKLIFEGNSAFWEGQSGCRYKTSGAEWQLIKAIFLYQQMHWLDGFLIFDRWRHKDFSKDYIEIFRVLRSKAQGQITEVGIEQAKFISKDKRTYTLFVPKDQQFASSLHDAALLTDQIRNNFLQGQAKDAWQQLIQLSENINDGRSYAYALAFVAEIPKPYSENTQLINAIHDALVNYEEILSDAIIKVSQKATFGKGGISSEIAYEVITKWISELSSLRQTLVLIEGKSEKSPIHTRGDSLVEFVRQANAIRDYLLEYCPSRPDRMNLNDAFFQDKEALLVGILKTEVVLNIEKELTEHFEKLPYLKVQASDVSSELLWGVLSWLYEQKSPIKATNGPMGSLAHYLRLHIESHHHVRNVKQSLSDDALPLAARHEHLVQLVKSVGGQGNKMESPDPIAAMLLNFHSKIPPSLRAYVRSFETIINDRTKEFVGREFVFSEIDACLNDPTRKSGYIVIEGDPGIGKSALLSQYILKRGLVIYHFNIGLQSINTSKIFLENICSRIIGYYDLPYDNLPLNHYEDGAFLNKLLMEVSPCLSKENPLIIAIDALDEVEGTRQLCNHNILNLPESLPDNVYIIATTRCLAEYPLRVMSYWPIAVKALSDENKQDIRQYLRLNSMRPKLKSWWQAGGIDDTSFVEMMVDKSEGNFMYLHYVLPEIERGKYNEGDANELPHGLRSYYRGHWRLMQNEEKHDFDSFYRPVVCVLAAAKQAVPVGQISRWTKIEDNKIREILAKWKEFLFETLSDNTKIYRLYHTSFRDYLQEEIDPGLKYFNRMISDAGEDGYCPYFR